MRVIIGSLILLSVAMASYHAGIEDGQIKALKSAYKVCRSVSCKDEGRR